MTGSSPAGSKLAGRVDLAWLAAVSFVTAGWVAVTVAGWELPFDTDGRGTAAAAAAAALTGAAWPPRDGRAAISAVIVLVLLPLAVAQAAGGSAALLAGSIMAAGAKEGIGSIRGPSPLDRKRLLAAAALVLAAGCLLAAIVVEGGEGISRPLPSVETVGALLGAVAGALLVLVASLGPRHTRVLVVPGLLIGTVAVAGLPELAVAGTGAAAATLWAVRAPHRATPALGALAAASVALPGGGQAAALLAAAAVLSVVFDHPASALLGIPGAAALASGFVSTGWEWSYSAVVVGTAVTGLALSRGASARSVVTWAGRPGLLNLMPTAGLALWLLLSPGSWGWSGAPGLGTYDRGALVASAVALLVVVGCRARAMSSRPAP